MWWHYLVYLAGYFISVMGGHFVIKRTKDPYWKWIGWSESPETNTAIQPHPEIPETVGFIERFLYTSSVLVGRPEFIGIWLALKVAGGWRGWTEDRTTASGKTIPGRNIFNVFIIFSGISLAYAIVSGFLIRWLIKCKYEKVFVTLIITILGTISFWLYSLHLKKKH